VLAIDFGCNGAYLATGGGVPSRSGELKIWRTCDGRLMREFRDAHRDTVLAVRFSPDGQRLASAGADRVIKIWSVDDGRLIRVLSGHAGHVLSLSWSGDGAQLVSGGADQVLKLWDVAEGSLVRTMKGTTYQIGAYKREVTSAAFVGDSEQILASSGDGTVRLHRTTSDNDILTYARADTFVYSAAATPDGRTVIAGGADGILRVWSGQDRAMKQALAP
jgi:WD40 repeat protein